MRKTVLALLVCIAPLASCGLLDPPAKVNDLGGDTPFHLILTNQSFEVSPVDIDVYVDGVHVSTGWYSVGSQHSFITFDFMAAQGAHHLKAVSASQDVTFETDFDLPAERWGLVSFWYYPEGTSGAEPMERQLTWTLFDDRPMFE